MKFYSIKQGKSVNVPDQNITARTTKNNRWQLVARVNGDEMYKFATEATAKRFR